MTTSSSLIVACCLWVITLDGGGTVAGAQCLGRPLFEKHRTSPVSVTLLGHKKQESIIPLRPRDRSASPTATVFGFLPYWSDASHLRYELLTHVACASVEVNRDGSLGNDHGWPWTSVINDAHLRGVKVILVATLFGSDNILALITDNESTTRFFNDIKDKMHEGSADGLNIDFEDTATGWVDHINSFMADLTAYLHAELPGCEVTIDGPAVNWSNVWDLPDLAAACDGIFIMGYDFYGSWSPNSGPVAPLTGGSFNITDTVLEQYGSVLQNAPHKLILGVPYYGAHWTTETSTAHAPVTGWIGSIQFSSAQPEAQIHGLLWNADSQTPWYRWHDGSSWHQVWFDNAASLGLKYDLAISHSLQGVGMWALGYDGDRSELWDVLQEKFGGGVPQPVPAASVWSTVAMALVILAAGTAALKRHCR